MWLMGILHISLTLALHNTMSSRCDVLAVGRIIHRDLGGLNCVKKCGAQQLTPSNCTMRLTRARQLLRNYPTHAVDFIVFTGEKVFTVEAPINTE